MLVEIEFDWTINILSWSNFEDFSYLRCELNKSFEGYIGSVYLYWNDVIKPLHDLGLAHSPNHLSRYSVIGMWYWASLIAVSRCSLLALHSNACIVAGTFVPAFGQRVSNPYYDCLQGSTEYPGTIAVSRQSSPGLPSIALIRRNIWGKWPNPSEISELQDLVQNCRSDFWYYDRSTPIVLRLSGSVSTPSLGHNNVCYLMVADTLSQY